MKKITIKNANENLDKLVSDVNDEYEQIKIINNKGKNAVLISEAEWKSIEETLHLTSIPGFVENIKKINKEEDWSKTEIYNKDLYV